MGIVRQYTRLNWPGDPAPKLPYYARGPELDSDLDRIIVPLNKVIDTTIPAIQNAQHGCPLSFSHYFSGNLPQTDFPLLGTSPHFYIAGGQGIILPGLTFVGGSKCTIR